MVTYHNDPKEHAKMAGTVNKVYYDWQPTFSEFYSSLPAVRLVNFSVEVAPVTEVALWTVAVQVSLTC